MIKFKTFFMVQLLIGICYCASAQQRSAPQTANDIDQLYKKLDTVISKAHIPGLMVAIVKKIVFYLRADWATRIYRNNAP